MPTFGRGVNKNVVLATETTFGSQATGPGQLLRRVSCQFNINAPLIPSAEIIPSQQIRDARQGPRTLSGSFSGQLAPGAYTPFLAAMMRSSFTNGATSGATAMTDLTAYAGGGANTGLLGLASASVNFRTQGFNVGDIIRISQMTGTYAANNSVNMIVCNIASSGLVMFTTMPPGFVLFGTAQTAKIGAVKKLLMPQVGVVQPSFTVEEWYSDVSVSTLSLGVTVTQMQFQLPARGFVTFTGSFTGQNQVESSSQVYGTPTAVVSSPSMTMNGGLVLYQGAVVGYMSNASLSISAPAQSDPMIGTNITPAVFLGVLSATGSFTCLMTNDTMTNDFLLENEVQLCFLMTANSSATNGSAMSFYMPRVKLGAAAKQDSQTAITRSFNFQALENTGTVADADLSTIVIQDTAV